jgi:hypothetical protein
MAAWIACCNLSPEDLAMNHKFGRDHRYRDERYSLHERSPDQEFETSAPYSQPADYGENYRDRSRNQGPYAPSFGAGIGRRGPVWVSETRGGYAGRGPKDYKRSDDRIREDVCDRLSWSDEVDATDIAVRVQDSEVMLEGSVATRHMKRLAEDLAEEVLGVRDVHNTLRVTKPILTQIKEKLSGESQEQHYANTGTRSGPGSAVRSGAP